MTTLSMYTINRSIKDVEVINLELILADLATVSKRLQNLGKEVKAGKKEAVIEHKLLEE